MTKSSAAKKTEPKHDTTKFRGGEEDSDICVNCGHDDTAHDPEERCPPLPPSKKVDHPANCTTCKTAPFLLRIAGEVRAGHYADRRTAVDFGKSLKEGPFEVITSGGRVYDVVSANVVGSPKKPNLAAELAAADEEGAKQAERKKLALVNFEKVVPEPVSVELDISRLRPMEDNPRGEVGDVSELEASIRSIGFKFGPLCVRPIDRELGASSDLFEVWAGNRRLKAAKQAGLTSVPCDVYDIDAGQALELNMTEQIQREDLTPLQEGDACRRLMELNGYTEQQVAEKFGKSASWVTKRVGLGKMAPELRKALSAGELPLTTALALGSLTTHQQQLKAFETIDHMIDGGYTAEEQVDSIRLKVCRPLSDATWKLTDADLVAEAGACSTCPHNSANAKMPGLFDNTRAKPTCANIPCFEDKELAEWLRRTAKHKAAGAKVLSLSESRKLFARGNDIASDSRYVDAGVKAAKDKQGRTWGELAADIEKEERPQLHVAQDNLGKLRELYVADKLLEGIATHLKLRWAKNVVEEAEERRAESSPDARAKKDAEIAERALVMKVREEVTEATLKRIAVKFSEPGKFPVQAARFLAGGVGGRAVENFAAATGRKFRKDWLEKEATLEEALAVMWLAEAIDHLSPHSDGLNEELVRIAKVHGINVEAAIKAQLETAKAEAKS